MFIDLILKDYAYDTLLLIIAKKCVSDIEHKIYIVKTVFSISVILGILKQQVPNIPSNYFYNIAKSPIFYNCIKLNH